VVTKGNKWAQTGHYTDSRGTVAGARTSEGGRVVAGSGQNGRGFVGQSGGGDVYAGKDGNVYKKTDSGWQQYGNGGWNSVDTSGAKAKAQQQTQTAGAQNQRSQKAQGAETMTNRQMGSQTSTTQAGAARETTPSTARQASPQAMPAQSGSFSQRQGQAPVGAGQSGQRQDLNREAQARQLGNQRTQNFQRQGRSSGARPRRGR
jgi:hypothetical protein